MIKSFSCDLNEAQPLRNSDERNSAEVAPLSLRRGGVSTPPSLPASSKFKRQRANKSHYSQIERGVFLHLNFL